MMRLIAAAAADLQTETKRRIVFGLSVWLLFLMFCKKCWWRAWILFGGLFGADTILSCRTT
jgi:hypothetical protein